MNELRHKNAPAFRLRFKKPKSRCGYAIFQIAYSRKTKITTIFCYLTALFTTNFCDMPHFLQRTLCFCAKMRVLRVSITKKAGNNVPAAACRKSIFRQADRLRETHADEEKASVGIQRQGRRKVSATSAARSRTTERSQQVR